MEKILGVKLLHRTTRSVSLTPEGERYLEGAKKALDDLNIVGAEVADTHSTPKGRLKLSASPPMARLWLTDIIAEFLAQWPEVEIELTLDDRLIDLAAEGVDLAIRSGGLADSEHLIARKIYAEEFHICATPGYWNKHGRPNHLQDLTQHTILRFRSSQTGRLFPWLMMVGGKSQRIELPARFIADEGEMILNLGLTGAGVGQYPGFMVHKYLASGRFEEVLADYRPPSTPISAMYLDRRLLPPRVRSFIDFLRSRAPVKP